MNGQAGAGGNVQAGGGGNQQQPVPVQTCRLPTPQTLTLTETRESITTWMDVMHNYLLRDANSTRFVTPGFTWNPALADNGHYGLAAEGPGTKLRRTQPEMEAALREMFRTVSSFFPFGFLKREFPLSTSWPDMLRMIYKAYNMQLNAASLLSYTEVKRSPDENYYIFHARLYDYFYQHLAPANATGAGHVAPAGGDTMSLSQANMIAILWLEKIDKRLLPLIKQEYGVELRNEATQLADLVPRLAQDMDILLAKLDETKVQRFGAYSKTDGKYESRTGKYDDKKKKFGGKSGGGKKERKSRDQDQLHCPHCKYLSKEMVEIVIPFDHSPMDCPRKRVRVQGVGASKAESDSESENFFSEDEFTTEGE